jgi:hypothetical protein
MSEAPTIRQLPTTIYDKMVFGNETWRKGREGYREFPMAIPLVDGQPCFDPKVLKDPYDRTVKPVVALPVVIVNSEEELDALRGGAAVVADGSGGTRVEAEEDVKAGLLVRADQLGVKVDKRWGVDRIRAAIAEAEEPI